MGWLLVCLVGLGLETGVIIVLGRQVTRRYEAETAGGPERPLWAPRDAARHGHPDQALPGLHDGRLHVLDGPPGVGCQG